MKIIRKPDGTFEIKRRRSWWEMNEAAKQYMEHSREKWANMKDRNLAHDIAKLPSDFTCWDFAKGTPLDTSLHIGIIVAMARPKGALEYVCLEMEHITLRSVAKTMRLISELSL